jgi:adenylate kinase family enzyme
MRRVAIIGCGGAGKTTLALELGQILGLPVVHIDAHWWRAPGASSEPWPAIHRRLVAADAWIIDGMKPGILAERLERADTVLFLDLPRRTCLRAVAERRLRFGRRPRPELGRPDRLTWAYVRWVWRFPRDVRPSIVDHLAQSACEVVVLRRRSEIDAYVAGLVATRPSPASDDVGQPDTVAVP